MASLNQKISINYESLGKTILFNGLSSPDLETICQQSFHKIINKGSFFFLQEDPAISLYLLVSGRIKLTQSDEDGQQILMRAIGPYTFFGAVAFRQNEKYPVTAEAAEDCKALGWEQAVLSKIIIQYPVFTANAIQLMADSVKEFQERFRQMATERVERRLAHTLLRLANQTGKKIPEGILLDFPLTRQDLAEMTGTTLFTVSRLLTAWEAQGLIIADRERIVIKSPHRMVEIGDK